MMAEEGGILEFIEKVDVKKVKKILLQMNNNMRTIARDETYFVSQEQQKFYSVLLDMLEEFYKKLTTPTWRLIQAVAPIIAMVIAEGTKKGGAVDLAKKLVRKFELIDLLKSIGEERLASEFMPYLAILAGEDNKEEKPTEA